MEIPTLRQLNFAVAVADHGHFGRAAEACHISQPGLSSQIHELERRLGVSLFERSARRTKLTAAGEEAIARARKVLLDIEELIIAASMHKGTVHGKLTVAAIPTMAPYLLPPLVRTLLDTWPGVELKLQELQTASIIEAIERGELDLGLLAVPIETRSLHVEEVFDEPFLLALPMGHELAGTGPLALSVLTDLPMLLLEEGHCLREHALNACAIAGQVGHSEIHAASLATLTQMVASNVGVTLLPKTSLSVETRPGTGVTTRPFEEPAPGRTIALVWRTTDPRSDLFSSMAEKFREQFALDG